MRQPPRHPWSPFGFAAAMFLLTALPGQDPDRVPVPDPTQRATSRSERPMPEPPPVVATRILLDESVLSDEPDFAPMQDVRDENGNIVDVKRVGNPYVLAFTNGDYTPPRGVDPELRRTLLTRPTGNTYGFVMIRGRMSREKLSQLEVAGLTLLDLHTYQSVVAKIPAAALPALSRMPFVHWVGYARRHQKIDRNFAAVLDKVEPRELLPIVVNPFESDVGKAAKVVVDGEHRTRPDLASVDAEEGTSTRVIPNGRFHEALVASGFEFGHYNGIVHAFHGRATKAQILKLLAADWVHTVELDSPMEACHDQAIPMVRQDTVRARYPGKGVACGVIDDGMDTKNFHIDFSGKAFVFFTHSTTPRSFHGTHVAGTIFGTGISDSRYQGAVPTAGTGGATNRIFVGSFYQDLDTNVARFQKSFKDASGVTSPYPRVISNSYGNKAQPNGVNGTDADSRTIDTATYRSRQLWVFAAGNKKDVANWWCVSPGAAKNALTVGAATDLFNSARTLNPGQRWAKSRWGVTDERTKPEVVAPGNSTTSTAWNSKTGYTSSSGTSMATPLVAGCCISRIQASSFYRTRPEAIKARAVASAMNDNTLGNGVLMAPQSGAPRLHTTGFGMINSRVMSINSSSETRTFTYASSFSKSGNHWSSDFVMPSNAQKVRFVICYTEPAASSSAKIARRNSLMAHLDFPPFSSGNHTGDYRLLSNRQNVMVGNITVPASARGKTWRVKNFAQSIPFGDAVFWSVVVQIYLKQPEVTPFVRAKGAAFVKRNSNYTLTGIMQSPSGFAAFQNGRLYYDGAFSIQGITRKIDDFKTQSYTSANNHPSASFPEVGKGAGTGMTIGTGTYRTLDFLLRSPNTDGMYTLTVGGTYGSMASPAPLKTAQKFVCVDGAAPNAIRGLRSTTHVANEWSNKTDITFQWTAPSDQGCADIEGVAHVLDTKSPYILYTIKQKGKPTSVTINGQMGNSTKGYSFYIRAADKVGNYGPVAQVGPYKIDLTTPVMQSAQINGNATYTSSPIVQVVASASDSISGPKSLQYSMDGSTWSPSFPYTTAPRSIDTRLYGGQTKEGTKTVWIRALDHAGNTSKPAFDTIIYQRLPAITGGPITSVPNVNYSRFVLTGTDLIGVNRVEFNSTALAKFDKSCDDWWATGAYDIVDDRTLHVYPPQGLAPATYGVKCSSAVGAGNTFGVKITKTTARVLHTNAKLPAGKTMTFMMSQGTEPSGTTGILVLSPVKTPSVLPGVVSLGIGAGFTAYVELPGLPFDGNGVLKMSFATDVSWKGVKSYIQGVYLRNPLPLPTTNVWQFELK